MIGFVVVFNVFGLFGVVNVILISDGIVMDYLKLLGYDGDWFYQVMVRCVIQWLIDLRIIDFEMIWVDIVLFVDESVQVVVFRGIYNNVDEIFCFYDGV